MSQTEHHHHHTHRHRSDYASRWKHKSLLNIERRKKLKKWLFRLLIAIAVLMAIAVVYVYSVT